MSNRSKLLLVLAVLLFGCIVALPNVFPSDPAIYVSRTDGVNVDGPVLNQIRGSLDAAGLGYLDVAENAGSALVRFADVQSRDLAGDRLGEDFPNLVVAITMEPRVPAWMRTVGLEPMNLGLDLSGGVHFLYQVDLEAAIESFLGVYQTDLRNDLRDANIRGSAPRIEDDAIIVGIENESDMDRVFDIIRRLDPDPLVQRLSITRINVDGGPGYRVEMTETLIRERQDFAIQQNTVTLRNRVNELGVAEPVVQRQGLDRILVQLPGVQDPAQAKRILGATATLEFRLVDWEADAYDAERRGRAPLGSELFHDRDGVPVVLRREVIVSGDQLVDAAPTYQQGLPVVSVRLNAQGADRMLEATQQNVGRPLAVLFIEETPVIEDGEIVDTEVEEQVISTATINGVFSSSFVITGLTPFESQDLALLLRAGALATPIVIVEELTIGPSLGQDNIDRGRLAVVIGFLLVMLFMAVYYRLFGIIANLALLVNVILIIALLSLVQAALTLPGIAGIVLTVGMAVDANVLIFERIREELRNGNSPLASIRAGYDKAFSTIADANITTLIAAFVLFILGTGPIKGFAITLAFGIVTSMFTAIIGTRAVVDTIYGRRKQVAGLSIGGVAHAAA
ncbi:MAG: protein translocase subunit SecD [Gammaproteobacteria bacterium]|jgi:preprotein translocase subunit SecD